MINALSTMGRIRSFWNTGDDYAIMTQDELDAYIESQGMKMGGM